MDYKKLTYEEFVAALHVASDTYRQNFYVTKMADREPDWRKLLSARIDYPFNKNAEVIEKHASIAILSFVGHRRSIDDFQSNLSVAYDAYEECLKEHWTI